MISPCYDEKPLDAPVEPDFRPIRILLAAPSLRFVGGQSVQATRLLEQLRRDPRVEVRFLPHDPRLPGPLAALERIPLLRTLLREIAYCAGLWRGAAWADVVHTFAAGFTSFVLAPTPAVWIARRRGARSIVHYHDGRAPDHLARWPSAIGVLKQADVVVTPTRYLADLFAEFGIEAEAIFNSLETEGFRYRERTNPRPTFYHNRGHEPVYDVPTTLRAFARIQQRCPEAVLRLSHDGPLRPALERQAAELGLRNVDFLGKVSLERNAKLYDQADVYLMSPRQDNMPLSVLESFASGLPVVSTEAGGVPCLIEDGVTGLLAPVGDDAALATAACRVLEEPGLAARLGRAGRREAEKYSWAAVGAQWIGLYERLGRREP